MARLNVFNTLVPVLLLLGAAQAPAAESNADEVARGQRIYQEGILSSGAPMKGVRFGNSAISGSQAACVTCHRRSGMGAVEGDVLVPPVTGNALFETHRTVVAMMDPRRDRFFNQRHAPYTDDTLAKAIRGGINNSGHDMSRLMPRYNLSDADLKALTAYLKQLSDQWSPGVTADTIRFATVIAPGVDPTRRKALLDTLQAAFAQKNGATFPGRRYMAPSPEMMLETGRRWELEVWELHGSPDTWEAQLEQHYRSNPVFALVSGLSDTTWAPVDAFCQKEQVPCWFPSVDLPVTKESFYPLYFSRGVALEADVLAKHLESLGDAKPHRVVQVYRDDYVGHGAADALKQDLLGSGMEVEDHILKDKDPGALRRLMAGIPKTDTVMFWLRPADLAQLDGVDPVPSAYFSAFLSDAENGPFPAAWKKNAQLVYPYELPEKRRGNMEYFWAWTKLRRLVVVDEPLQAEAFFAVDSLASTVSEMLDNLYRDYLLERAENMLTRNDSAKAEQQVRDRAVFNLRKTALNDTPQQGTSIYPRISLGPDQRFASKGGYIVRFADAGSDRLVAESGWIVP